MATTTRHPATIEWAAQIAHFPTADYEALGITADEIELALDGSDVMAASGPYRLVGDTHIDIGLRSIEHLRAISRVNQAMGILRRREWGL